MVEIGRRLATAVVALAIASVPLGRVAAPRRLRIAGGPRPPTTVTYRTSSPEPGVKTPLRPYAF